MLLGGVSPGAALAPQPSEDPSIIGEWAAPMAWPVIGVHAALLRTGKVLHYSWPETTPGAEAWLWDPETETLEPALADRNVFCGAHAFLPNGRLLVTGGSTAVSEQDARGSKDINVFDPFTETWTYVGDMQVGRWYPTNITLPDGRILVVSGLDEQNELTDLVEVYNPSSGMQVVAGANKLFTIYPRMHVLPSGKVFHAGPENLSSTFDPATLTWQGVAFNNYGYRGMGTSVLLPLEPPDYRPKVLILGGGMPSTDTAEIIDLADPRPAWSYTASMNHARRHTNAVLLPDGKVLVAGGTKGGLAKSPVFQAEIFDPVSETWTAVASMDRPREHHSTAILLPDGRVLAAGSDGEFTTEIYSPPYLFQGPRPRISYAPGAISYGSSFQVPSPDTQDIATVALIRPSAMTHSVNTEQRYVELEFETSTDVLTVQAPPSRNLAPPGYYMLFVINSQGVPSEATFIRLGATSDSDGDGDGFTDGEEGVMGTDPNDNCPDNTSHDAWPPDIDNDRIVGVFDILSMSAALNVGAVWGVDPEFRFRYDLDADKVIGVFDILTMSVELNAGATCT